MTQRAAAHRTNRCYSCCRELNKDSGGIAEWSGCTSTPKQLRTPKWRLSLSWSSRHSETLNTKNNLRSRSCSNNRHRQRCCHHRILRRGIFWCCLHKQCCSLRWRIVGEYSLGSCSLSSRFCKFCRALESTQFCILSTKWCLRRFGIRWEDR